MKIMKKMFNPKKGNNEQVTGVSIFDQWKQEAKDLLDGLKDLYTKDKEWFMHIIAYHILVQHIKFIT